jgi:AGZA family xanthine/uracil permease-like MFS transporter
MNNGGFSVFPGGRNLLPEIPRQSLYFIIQKLIFRMKVVSMKKRNYQWFSVGDINGFFGLMIDNLTVLSFLAGILIFVFQYPAEIVYKRMFPGTALGVLFGDLVYTFMAIRLGKKKKDPSVTAMPLGLDTPSTIGIALTVIGPAFIYLKSKGMAPYDAAMMTWYIGMATMIIIGYIKLVFSFFGNWLNRIIPQAGLLGSLAGIGLALIGFVPILDIFGLPVVGLISLGIILYSLVAKISLPRNFPAVLAAVGLGSLIYYICAPMGWFGIHYTAPPAANLTVGIPVPTLDFVKGFSEALRYLPIAFPFAILTVVGGINTTESARIAGDDYNTRDILLTEALSTLIAGLFGGVAQTTPYIGQPAYKAMGSRAGYTLMTGLFIGLGGILGYVSFIVELIPRPVLAPILIFVAIDIMAQAFHACPPQHAPAVALSYMPSVARLLAIKLNPNVGSLLAQFTEPLKTIPETLVVVALGNGFILTAMLWGAFIAKLIDKKIMHAVAFLLSLATLSFFGIIHSALPEGSMYLPWQLPWQLQIVPYQFTAGYVALAALFLVLSFITPKDGSGQLRTA